MQHGLYGDEVRNKESEKILESLCTRNLTVAKTIFDKRAIHLVTYESGPSKTLVDYCLVRRNQRTFGRAILMSFYNDEIKRHLGIVCTQEKSVETTQRLYKE